MPYSSDKPTPKRLLPAVHRKASNREPDVTVPIDINRLTELLDEATPPPGEPLPPVHNEFVVEEHAADAPLRAQPLAPAAEAEFDADETSDGASITEALINATDQHAAVTEQAKRRDAVLEVRAVPSGEAESTDELVARARALEADGDLDAAFEIVRRAQSAAPRRDDLAQLAQRLRGALVRAASARIGDLRAVPAPCAPESRSRGLPPRIVFLLAQVDGQRSFEQILAVSGMRRDDALRTFAKLLADGLIAVRER